MLAYLFITIWIIKLTFASVGFSTAGVNFVFSFPTTWTPLDVEVSMYMTTEVEFAEVHVMVPKQKHDIFKMDWNTTKYLIRRSVAVEHIFSNYADLVMNNSGVYCATRIKAFGQIRIFVLIDHSEGVNCDGLRLVPEASSYRHYYVTTAKANPFLLVTAFSQPAIVKVKFPNYVGEIRLNHTCGEQDNKNIVTNRCMSNTVNTIHLGAYNVWYFYIDFLVRNPPQYDFQNILVTSDTPISVVAGNSKCNVGDLQKSKSIDLCICNMKGTANWGKEYFVPQINSYKPDPMDIYFRINAIEFPVTLEIHFPPDTKQQEEVTDFSSILHLGEKKDSFVVTAKDPFALYFLTPCRVLRHLTWDASLLNVLPTELWMSGIVYVATPELQDAYTDFSFFLVINTKPDAIEFQDESPDKINWKPLMKINENDYHWAYVGLKGLTTRIVNKMKLGKLQLYVAGSRSSHSQFIFAYDFYLGLINHQINKCVESVRVLPSDGIDNDCDSRIDEELLNNLDDDGDGKIDEDYVEKYQDGGWSEWIDACTINCKNKTYVRQIRACGDPIPSRFGNPCKGKGEICTGNASGTCPKDCAGQALDQSCECQKGCSQCMENEAVCSSCKPGYYATKYCMIPCSKGFGGVGCSTVIVLNGTVPVTDNDTNDNDYIKKEEGFPWWLIEIGGVLAATIFAGGLCCLWRCCKKRTVEEMKVPEEEVVDETNDDAPEEEPGTNPENDEEYQKSKGPNDNDDEAGANEAPDNKAGGNEAPDNEAGGNVAPGTIERVSFIHTSWIFQ